jgi:hypothetical protein
MITSSCNLFISFSSSRYAMGPPLIYLLKNSCLFFTGLFDESYFLDVEERRVRRRQPEDLGESEEE